MGVYGQMEGVSVSYALSTMNCFLQHAALSTH